MRTAAFSVLIPRKSFVEALGLDFCPAVLSWGLCYGCIVGKASQKPNGLGLGKQQGQVEGGTGRQLPWVLFKP